MRPRALLPSLAALLLVLLPAAASAQTGVVVGTARDAATNAPLGAVDVRLGRAGRAATDPDGRFRLEGVAAGTYALVATRAGYGRAAQTVTVAGGDTVVVRLVLAERLHTVGEVVVEGAVLTGGRAGADALAGAATYLGPRELAAFRDNDIHRVLRAIPGVYVQEEDGYGLRPNIGMRGTGSDRSSKITVMEDGVLAAPAPYSAPAAYYFPTTGRMRGVEVVKGASQVKHGPYTTGGALNLISTPVPERLAGQVEVATGSYGGRTLDAYAGTTAGPVGVLIEAYRAESDGFKRLDGRGGTGFEKQDVLAKLALDAPAFRLAGIGRVEQRLLFKAGLVDETSDETYLGLTLGDFEAAPLRRYAASQQDRFTAEQRQASVSHTLRAGRAFALTTTLYRATFERNWYKLDRARATAAGPRPTLADVLGNPARFAAEYALLTGATSPNDNALEVKANNRAYTSEGVQTAATFRARTGALAHTLELGGRLHRDEADRFQWTDLYRMREGTMERTLEGTPGTESNRIESARARAAYAQYTLSWGRLTLVPGVRREAVTLRQRDFGRADVARAGTALKEIENRVAAWIPGVGADVRVASGVHVLGGVHRGFAPPGATPGARPERSVAYEAGTRVRRGEATFQAIAFASDYENLLGADLAAVGGDGTADQFNGGAVRVRGLEASVDGDLGEPLGTRVSLPVAVAYTYTASEFRSSFASTFEPWGTVQSGDALPYQPAHALNVRAGARVRRFDATLNASYVGRMRTVAGRGAYDAATTVPSHVVLDAAFSFALRPGLSLYSTVRNVTDAAYAVASRPSGWRPGLPRTLQVGVRTLF